MSRYRFQLTIVFCSMLFSQPAISDDASTELARAVNQFGFELYEDSRREPRGNFLISPLSIHTALSMAFIGAGGETRKQMVDVLEATSLRTELGPQMRTLMDAIDAGSTDAYKLDVANHIWVQLGFPVLPSYQQDVTEYFRAGAANLDFTAPGAEETINEWVEDATRGKIAKLFDQLDPATQLVIANAVYFLGDWVKPFKAPSGRRPRDDFHISPSETIQVDMMSHDGPQLFSYTENREVQVVEMPYRAENEPEISMVVVLPRKLDGLAQMERKLSGKWLRKLTDDLEEELVSIRMPRFMQRTRLDLNPILIQMGMDRAFTDSAEFPGISAPDEHPVKISKVVHEAYIRVDEEGTEAAAVTGVAMVTLTAGRAPPPHKVFHADHPFMFFIRHSDTGAILFMGRVMAPPKAGSE